MVYAEEDFEKAVKRITGGRGVDVVLRRGRARTYVRSMNALRPRGMLALYGEASGLVPPIDPRELLFRKSLYRPAPGSITTSPTAPESRSNRTDFRGGHRGQAETGRFSEPNMLEQVCHAHRAIESRATTGKLLVVP